MPNPWNRPEIPKRGDEYIDLTFIHVGRIMSIWEALEFELSRLYAFFAGAPYDIDIMQKDYGGGTIFRDRASALEAIADAYFTAHSNQSREGDFHEIISLARNYSARRNDIAHGIVFRVNDITYFSQRIRADRLSRDHFLLIPPLYAQRWHSKGLPDFAYSSVEMQRIENRLDKVRTKIKKFLSSAGVKEGTL